MAFVPLTTTPLESDTEKLMLADVAGPPVPLNVTVPLSVKVPGTGVGAGTGGASSPGGTLESNPVAGPVAVYEKLDWPAGLHTADVSVNELPGASGPA
jgi:hypothetical protein